MLFGELRDHSRAVSAGREAIAKVIRAVERTDQAWGRSSTMSDKKKRAERREQQSREVEASQKALRESITETERLVGESEEMLRRHRKECDDDDRGSEN